MTKAIPARPSASDPAVIERAAKRMAECLCANVMKDDKPEEVAADLIKCARWASDDGFRFASALESHAKWDCNFEIAEELNEFSSMVDDIVRDLEKQWAAANNIEPPFPIGTRVRLPRGGAGVIDAINQYGTATYSIAVDGELDTQTRRSRLIVNFEDVKPIESAA